MTPAERQAYIDTSRRSQPIVELERKAAKAKRRYWLPMEANDLALAQWRERHHAHLAKWPLTPPGGFCYLCSAFGIWDHEQGRYLAGPLHNPRCPFAPDDGPYPGWAAAGRPRPQERVPLGSAT